MLDDLQETQRLRSLLQQTTAERDELRGEGDALRRRLYRVTDALRRAPCASINRDPSQTGVVGAWHYDVCNAQTGGCHCWIGRAIAEARGEG